MPAQKCCIKLTALYKYIYPIPYIENQNYPPYCNMYTWCVQVWGELTRRRRVYADHWWSASLIYLHWNELNMGVNDDDCEKLPGAPGCVFYHYFKGTKYVLQSAKTDKKDTNSCTIKSNKYDQYIIIWPNNATEMLLTQYLQYGKKSKHFIHLFRFIDSLKQTM